MAQQIMRSPWLVYPRMDSRLLLKCLIVLNVILAVYNILTLQTGYRKTSPCVVVINTSNKNGPDNDIPDAQLLKRPPQIEDKALIENESRFQNLIFEPEKSTENPEINMKVQQFTNSSEEVQVSSASYSYRTLWWTTEKRGGYSVIRNYILADYIPYFNESVTLATQGTYEFLYHVEPLCQRWKGPLSVSVYAPGDDFQVALSIIYFLRNCKDPCVKKNVTWHLIYDQTYGTSLDNISFPDLLVNNKFDCTLSKDQLLTTYKSDFRRDHKTPYPINVARNVARLSSPTQFLIASDIELYPSINIVSMFLDLLKRERHGLVPYINSTHHVYVIPIFEVKAGLSPPETKLELKKMVKKGDAIFFHKWVCDSCQNFPDRDKWVELTIDNNTLNMFRSTKRTSSKNAWEPLYIGTNAEPLYDERLSWDGKRDKMSQMYEMCLKNYDLLILDNAFLVHAPGIKHIDPQDQRRRLPFIKRNNQIYNTIIAKLRKRYNFKNNC